MRNELTKSILDQANNLHVLRDETRQQLKEVTGMMDDLSNQITQLA